jgi:peptidoglycan/xylan/chitin deacetylase (PgdA/CDA1 family)
MAVNTYDRPVAMSLLESRAVAAGYWMQGRSPSEISNDRVSMAIGSYGGGRFVWTGFTLGSTVDPFGVKAGEILVRNMVAYVAFRPIFGKEPWPGGKQAAVAFAQETDDGLDAASAGASVFSKRRVPCTFFCSPESGQRNPAAFKALSAVPGFEIGLKGEPTLHGQKEEKQKEMLAGGKKALEALVGGTIHGFSPFEALYDDNTLKALLDSGYSYLAGDAAAVGPPAVLQAYKPRLLRIGRNLRLLIKFPHVGAAEAEIFPKDGKEDREKELERLKEDFDAVYQVGGFYNFSFHSALLKDKARAEVLSEFLDYVKTKNVWLTNFGEAADWSDRWMLVDLDSSKVSDVRTNLIVTNSSPDQIDSLRLNMYLPNDDVNITASSEKLGGSINVVSQQNGTAVLEVRDLQGEGLVFYVDSESALEN